MTGNKKYDVFISYSRKDFIEVETFKIMLQKRISGLKCWFDLTGIESGDEFSEKIVSAIDNSAYVLFMISDYSMASPWTKKEVTYAKNTGKRVIPILLKDSKIKGWFLFEYGLVDCIDCTDSIQVDKLISNLSVWIESKSVSTNTPKGNNEIAANGFTLEQAYQFFRNKQYEEAFAIYRILAGFGDIIAQSNLGLFYYFGWGCKQDYEQAVIWFRKAAEQGDADAQTNLGCCYHNGQGIRQDHTQAMNWFRKAAEQGHNMAIKWLEELYKL